MAQRSCAREAGSPAVLSRIIVPGNQGTKVVRAVTILKPASELYAFWRNVENLPRIIRHPVTIVARNENESHWSVTAPGDARVEWDSLIINDERDRLIAWRSREGAEIPNAGSVRFEPAPGDEGTEVTIALEYDAPGGRVGDFLAKLTGKEPAQQVADTLRRFKALMEVGEFPTTDGQSTGRPQRRKKSKEKINS
ncbi:MAG: cyclase [Opitutus sp.]|nr:cyclase [Opitutus sp.]